MIDDLSEQYLVDCANGYSFEENDMEWTADGCAGAWPMPYFDFLKKTNGGKILRKKTFQLVMFQAWIFRAFGRLRLLCIGPWAGWAFLYWVSSFFWAFPKYKMYQNFCLMSMKYEVLLLNFLKLSIGYKFGPI